MFSESFQERAQHPGGALETLIDKVYVLVTWLWESLQTKTLALLSPPLALEAPGRKRLTDLLRKISEAHVKRTTQSECRQRKYFCHMYEAKADCRPSQWIIANPDVLIAITKGQFKMAELHAKCNGTSVVLMTQIIHSFMTFYELCVLQPDCWSAWSLTAYRD